MISLKLSRHFLTLNCETLSRGRTQVLLTVDLLYAFRVPPIDPMALTLLACTRLRAGTPAPLACKQLSAHYRPSNLAAVCASIYHTFHTLTLTLTLMSSYLTNKHHYTHNAIFPNDVKATSNQQLASVQAWLHADTSNFWSMVEDNQAEIDDIDDIFVQNTLLSNVFIDCVQIVYCWR